MASKYHVSEHSAREAVLNYSFFDPQYDPSSVPAVIPPVALLASVPARWQWLFLLLWLWVMPQPLVTNHSAVIRDEQGDCI